MEVNIRVRIMESNVRNGRAYVPSHDPGFSVKVATSRGLSSFNTPKRILYSPAMTKQCHGMIRCDVM